MRGKKLPRESVLLEYSAFTVISELLSSMHPYNKHLLLQQSNTSYLFLPCSCYVFQVGGNEDFQEEKAKSWLVSMKEQWSLQISKATEIPANGCKHKSVILSIVTLGRKIALTGNAVAFHRSTYCVSEHSDVFCLSLASSLNASLSDLLTQGPRKTEFKPSTDWAWKEM